MSTEYLDALTFEFKELEVRLHNLSRDEIRQYSALLGVLHPTAWKLPVPTNDVELMARCDSIIHTLTNWNTTVDRSTVIDYITKIKEELEQKYGSKTTNPR
jgi:hypothetical protein